MRARVTPRTRLIALSAVSWLDGKVFPWRELREATGVPVLVDGAQSVGAIEVDCDRGRLLHDQRPEVALRPGCLRRALRPRSGARCQHRLVSRTRRPRATTSPRERGSRSPAPSASILASPRPASLAGLEAALTIQPAGRFERAVELADRCGELLREAGLTVVSEPGQSTLVSFRARGNPAETVAALYEQGVLVRELPHTDYVRASVGWWNDESDLERLVAGL